MSSLDSAIDRLYQGPLDDFVAARNALAKTVAGVDARRVKALTKPTVVPWAVNQVYWHARPVYDRLIQAGAALRTAQIATLGGTSADVHGAVQSHRAAIARAVEQARKLATSDGAQPDPDALSRTFEALSLATSEAEPAGRLTKPLQLAGFEALAGVTVKAQPQAHPQPRDTSPAHAPHARAPSPRGGKKDELRERREAQREARTAIAAKRKREAEIARAKTLVERARAAEEHARRAWEQRTRELEDAEKALERLDEP